MGKEKEHLNYYIGKTTEKLEFERFGQCGTGQQKLREKFVGG